MSTDNIFSLNKKKVFVAGHKGLLGSSICRRLLDEGVEVVTVDRSELDLTRQNNVESWFNLNRPDVVIIAAAKVGGIYANSNYPGDFIYQNLAIEMNLIHTSYLYNVEKLIMLGSSCSYPKLSPQPIPESALLDGKPESTNQWYSVAKIAGIKLCEAYRKQYKCDFISILPANLYGPGDNFDPDNSHVVPGLIRRFYNAIQNEVFVETIWGTGTPLRELMYVDDASDAIVFLIKNYSSGDVINIGTGVEMSISDIATTVSKVVGFNGKLVFDISKPDGAPRKVLDISKISGLGWKSKTNFEDGIEITYKWFVDNKVI
jgi:GDP-L-fucose synthase